MRFLLLILILYLPITFAARPFVVDMDAALDDAIAILYLMNRNDVDIKAITIATTGESDCQPGIQNMSRLLLLANKKQIPIACGRTKPLTGSHQFPQWIKTETHQLNGMAKFLSTASFANNAGNAADLLIKKLDETKEKITIVVIGPLTNIAEALQKKPSIKNKIKMIYIMGGAVNVPGNITVLEPKSENKVSEWNIYIDPTAADIVFKSGAPITLVPLDATNQVPINNHFYNHFEKYKTNTAQAKFISQLFFLNKQKFIQEKWSFWDTLAAVIATDQSFVNTQRMKLKVVLAPENASGSIVWDEKNGKEIIVCNRVDAHHFYQVALQTMMP